MACYINPVFSQSFSGCVSISMAAIKTSKNLLKLTVEERQKFLSSFDMVMVDCDGCIWSLLSPIQGAGDGLRALEQLQKRIVYVSNNSVRSVTSFRTQLEQLGLQLDEVNLVNSVIAIVHYLHKKKFQDLIYVIGSGEMRKRLKSEGFNVISGVGPLAIPEIHNNLIRSFAAR